MTTKTIRTSWSLSPKTRHPLWSAGMSLALGTLLAAWLPACGGTKTGTTGGSTTAAGGGGAGGNTTGGTGGTGAGGNPTGGTGGNSTGGTGGDSTGGTGTGGNSTGGTGTGGNPQPAYPAGPYGQTIGSTIDDLSISGFAAPQVSVDMVVAMHLGEFYNPSGQGTFPPGSPYGEGKPLPTALFLHAAAVWSGPSNFQTSMVEPAAVAKYGACLTIIDVLIDGPAPGVAATEKSAYNWALKYKPTGPVAFDPMGVIKPFAAVAFPTNIVIDTKTMKIVDILNGAADAAYFQNKVAPLCQ